MKKIKFTGLLTRKKAVRYLIYILFVCVFAVFVIKLNQVEKTELVVRTGQTFEKAKVVKSFRIIWRKTEPVWVSRRFVSVCLQE